MIARTTYIPSKCVLLRANDETKGGGTARKGQDVNRKRRVYKYRNLF